MESLEEKYKKVIEEAYKEIRGVFGSFRENKPSDKLQRMIIVADR